MANHAMFAAYSLKGLCKSLLTDLIQQQVEEKQRHKGENKKLMICFNVNQILIKRI